MKMKITIACCSTHKYDGSRRRLSESLYQSIWPSTRLSRKQRWWTARKLDCVQKYHRLFDRHIHNIQLQDEELNLIKTRNVVSAWDTLLFKRGKGDYNHFSTLSALSVKHETYCQHLGAFHADFIERFQDILNMNLPSWVLETFRKCRYNKNIKFRRKTHRTYK